MTLDKGRYRLYLGTKKVEKRKSMKGAEENKKKYISGGESVFKVQRRTFSNKSVLQTKVCPIDDEE